MPIRMKTDAGSRRGEPLSEKLQAQIKGFLDIERGKRRKHFAALCRAQLPQKKNNPYTYKAFIPTAQAHRPTPTPVDRDHLTLIASQSEDYSSGYPEQPVLGAQTPVLIYYGDYPDPEKLIVHSTSEWALPFTGTLSVAASVTGPEGQQPQPYGICQAAASIAQFFSLPDLPNEGYSTLVATALLRCTSLDDSILTVAAGPGTAGALYGFASITVGTLFGPNLPGYKSVLFERQESWNPNTAVSSFDETQTISLKASVPYNPGSTNVFVEVEVAIVCEVTDTDFSMAVLDMRIPGINTLAVLPDYEVQFFDPETHGIVTYEPTITPPFLPPQVTAIVLEGM
jgi:hypothetical protein